MLGRLQRDGDPRERPEFARPLTRAVDDELAARFPFAVVRLPANARDAAVRRGDGRDLRPLEDAGAAAARALRERLREIGGVRLAVARDPHAAGQVVRAQQRRPGGDLRRRQPFELDAEAARARHLPAHELQALRRLRDVEAPARLPPGRESGLALERRVELDPVAAHPRGVARGAHLPDESRRVPRGAARQPALLEQDHVGNADLREVISGRCAGDAAADDDDTGVGGNVHAART